MFSLIRGVIIIGLIFYFSPERDMGESEPHAYGGERTPAPTALPPMSDDSKSQNGLWNRIVGSLAEEVIRTAVEERVQDTGRGLKEASLALQESSPKSASTKTVRSSDRDAAGRVSPGESVRCVYRCDGAE